jgi:hypothetical protein
MLVRAATSTPTNIIFGIEASDDATTWSSVWRSNTSVLGTNTQIIRLRAPRYLDPRFYYRWFALSSGTPVLAGAVRFSAIDSV